MAPTNGRSRRRRYCKIAMTSICKTSDGVDEDEDAGDQKMQISQTKDACSDEDKPGNVSKIDQMRQKFEMLRNRYSTLRSNVEACQKKTEERKNRKRMKKKTTDEEAKEEDADKMKDADDVQKWQELKPYLTINDHLAGPVSHGIHGPKTELEEMVDKAISEGDFDKAEMLSDNLADRKFAVKIKDAFAAKRCAEQKAEEDAIKKAKRLKKLHWTFETKERWQMKSNM